jgi:hypothetical protein
MQLESTLAGNLVQVPAFPPGINAGIPCGRFDGDLGWLNQLRFWLRVSSGYGPRAAVLECLLSCRCRGASQM